MSHDCFADEIAIDFPSMAPAIERMRDAFLGIRGDDTVVRGALLLTGREAWEGVVAPVDVPLVGTCAACAGRGETWDEPCGECRATGQVRRQHRLSVTVPPRVLDGTRFRFRVTSPLTAPVSVEIRVAIQRSAA